jgi:hypothetical protein
LNNNFFSSFLHLKNMRNYDKIILNR